MISTVITYAAFFMIVAQLVGFFQTFRQVLVKGRMAGSTMASVLLGLLFLLPMFELAGVLQNFGLYLACVGVLGMYIINSPGLGRDGLIYNGKIIPYSNFSYYHFSRETPRLICFRLNTEKKDYIVLFRARYRQQLIAKMEEAGVQDWDSFCF